MTIWLISLFDPTPVDDVTSTRFVGIAKAANALGIDVVRFTSTFKHAKKKHRFEEKTIYEVNPHYKVVFLKTLSYQKNMTPDRFFSHWLFARQLVKEFDQHEKPDAIFISMPPLSTINYVTKWGVKNKVPVTIDIIDPWPDSFIKDVPAFIKPLAKIAIYPYYRRLRNSFNRSKKVTAISRGYLNWASSFFGPAIESDYFYLAADLDEVKSFANKTGEDEKNKDQLRLIYAGSLASSYDIPCILQAAEILSKKYPGKTKFIITGLGPQKNLVEEYEKQLDNIEYLGWVTKEELIKQYHLADVGLIQHKNNLTQTVTYKLFNYVSAGMAVLNSLESEMMEIVDTKKIGLNNPPQQPETLAKNIEYLLNNPDVLSSFQQNATSFVEEEGDSKVVYEKLVRFAMGKDKQLPNQ